MELFIDDQDIPNKEESINFVYLKNELQKMLGIRLPEQVPAEFQDLFRKIFDKMNSLD